MYSLFINVSVLHCTLSSFTWIKLKLKRKKRREIELDSGELTERNREKEGKLKKTYAVAPRFIAPVQRRENIRDV